MEYIERDKLIGDGWHLQRLVYGNGYACIESMDIRDIPAADVRPVVFCRDCKHWETNWTPRSVSDGRHYCAPLDLFPPADWYCSDGEKREES